MIVTEKTLGGYKKTVSRTETHFEKIYMYEDLYHYSTTMTRFKLYQSYLASKGIVCDIEDKHTNIMRVVFYFSMK